MKTIRAIGIGAVIWILGVSLYSLSFYVNILEDAEKQANLVLFVAVIPLVWLGSKLYYKEDDNTHGYLVGLTFFLVAAALDALITVPFLMIPNGISHYEFYTDIGFWMIGLEFIAIAVLHWYIKVYRSTQKSI